MFKLSLFTFGLLAIMVPLCAQSSYYLPQIIDGRLANFGVRLRTTIILSNARCHCDNHLYAPGWHAAASQFPRPPQGSQFSLLLKPFGTRILQTDGSGDGSAGAAAISSTVSVDSTGGLNTGVALFNPQRRGFDSHLYVVRPHRGV